ncbi:MAG: M56 family metallopeptidase [Acidobacteria bacterium]|nr:M56 family metallopeptidase [Acidobacteriota bacterium]
MSEFESTIALQSVVLMGSSSAICWLLRRQSAALRHAVWTLGMLFLLGLPLMPLLPQASEVVPIAVPFTTVTRIEVRGGEAGWSLVEWLPVGWMIGVGVLLLVEVVRQVRGEWLRRRSVAGGVGYRLSPDLAVPAVCGLFAPTVLLPLEAEEWTVERLEAVLAHERMHVLRRDLWWHLLGRIACAFYWPNPYVCLAVRAQQRECEQACDDGVVIGGVGAADYAEHLIEVARSLNSEPLIEGGLSMAKQSNLEQRLRALLNPMTSHQPVSRGTLVLMAVVSLALLAPVVGLRLIAQEGGVKGVVRDASGANVAGAKVSLRFLKPGMSQRVEMVKTNAAGEFSFPSLPEGDGYSIYIEKEGFAVLSNTMIKLSNPMWFTLNVGGLRETVNVNGGSIPPPPPPPPPPYVPIPDGPNRIRIGGNVQAAKLVNRVAPIYPADCKEQKVEGVVLFDAVIGRDGGMIKLEIVNQFVDPRLKAAAMEAVKLWRYEPTLLNGNQVEVSTRIEVNFTLAN